MKNWHNIILRLSGILVLVSSSAMAISPDSWMEWISWGATVLSHEVLRIVLGVLAIVVLLALLWPLIRPARHTE